MTVNYVISLDSKEAQDHDRLLRLGMRGPRFSLVRVVLLKKWIRLTDSHRFFSGYLAFTSRAAKGKWVHM